MKRIVIFLIIVYLVSALGAWALLSKNTQTNTSLAGELVATKNELSSAKSALETEKLSRGTLEKKIADARANATFLSLALCPVLESGNKSSLCMHDGTEWFNQTLQAGSATADVTIKSSMDAFTQSLGNTKKLSSKQFHEMLKPLEARAIRLIVESTSN